MRTVGKYARPEIERRWLVDLDNISSWQQLPSRRIEDLYVEGTLLRLRKVTLPGAGAQFKLGRKSYVEGSTYPWLTNIYLDPAEYEVLNRLHGFRLTKTRHSLEGGALDVPDEVQHHAVFEREFESEALAAAYEPPTFVGDEVTGRGTLSAINVRATSGLAPASGRRHRLSAGVLIEQHGKILLVHCQRPGVYDFWVAPGGGAHELEDLASAARREVLEECGLNVEIGKLAYVEEFYSPITRYCKLWFSGDVVGGNIDAHGNHASSEWITEARFLGPPELKGLQVFPAVLNDSYWADSAAGFTAPKYLGLREMTFW